MRRVLLVAVLFVLVPLLAVTVVPLLDPWSPLNCWHEEVDITTGRIRRQWYLLYIRVSNRETQTPVSEVIARSNQAGALPAQGPQWRRVNTFAPGLGYSPHYRHHSAIAQINELADLWALDFPEELKETTARHLVALWQEGSDDDLAENYLSQLHTLLDPDQRETVQAALADLPMPRVEKTIEGKTVKTLYYPTGQPMERCEGYCTTAGEFVPDGVWERWCPSGRRTVFGHFRAGRHHGRRFEWDQSGTLLAIAAFTDGQLTEYEGQNLAQHPDFSWAEKLCAGTSR